MLLMSGRNFFLERYRKLGWDMAESQVKQAIRVNTTNTQKKTVITRLKSQGVKLQKIPFLEDGYWIKNSKFSLGSTPEYLLGLYSIQEAASQIPAPLFKGLEELYVLDACAAPGGKTVQLANLMRNTGLIVALDVKKRRLAALSNHLERCQVKNTIIYNLDARKASRLNMKFDRILIDAPCSGNFANDSDWFNRRTIKDVERNASVQREIIAEAFKILKADGELVYSTCSLEPEENELNINWAIQALNIEVDKIECFGEKAATEVFGERLDSSIEGCRRIWPGSTQGFFVCKLGKAG
jgi:NOL1/NOP2/sun family putative RNA methylase